MQNYWKPNHIPEISWRKNLQTHWMATDSEARFDNDPTEGYTKESIVYKYNNHGYRTHEIDLSNKKKSIICIGCSFTEGTGVAYEDSWPAHIEKKFPDYYVYNFGVGGGSAELVARTLYNIGHLLQTSLVFILWPPVTRFEIYKDQGLNLWVPNKKDNQADFILIDDTHFFNLQQRSMAMVNLCQLVYRYKVIAETVDSILELDSYQHFIPEFYKKSLYTIDYGGARDKMHPGPAWHMRTAKMFFEKYLAH